MGEAKARGTFDMRVKLAKEKNKNIKKIQKRIAAKVVLPPRFVLFEVAFDENTNQSAVLLVDSRPKINCTLDQMIFPYGMMREDKNRCVRVFQTALKVDGVI